MEEKKRAVVEEMFKGMERNVAAADRLRSVYQGNQNEAEGQERPASPEEYASEQLEDAAKSMPRDGIYVARKVDTVRRNVDQIRGKQNAQRQSEAKQAIKRQGMPAHEKTSDTGPVRGTKSMVPQHAAPADVRQKYGQSQLNQKRLNPNRKTPKGKAPIKGAERIKDAISGVFKGITKAVTSNTTVIFAGAAAVILVVMLCSMVGMIFGSAFGIFFVGTQGNGSSQKTIQSVMRALDQEYDQKIISLQDAAEYDELQYHGAKPEWKEVLAVYAIRTNLDPNDSEELITMTAKKEKKLRNVYWDMVSVSSKLETEKRTVTTTVTDDSENVTEKKEEKEFKVLKIRTTSRSADEMAADYGFDPDEEELMHELLDGSNDPLWAGIIY